MIYVPEDRDDFHIEIYTNDKVHGRQIAEVYREDGIIKIEFYNNPFGNEWNIDMNYFINFLKKTFDELNVKKE